LRLADPTELRAARIGGPFEAEAGASRIVLRWQWPSMATATRLLARQGSPAGGCSDPAAIEITVSRADYERVGSWTMELPRAAPFQPRHAPASPPETAITGPANHSKDQWFVTAFSMAQLDGEIELSPGLEPSATTIVPSPNPQITVTYSLKRPWLRWRAWILTLHTEPANLEIPRLVVVANPRAVPLSADDGEIIARLPSSRDGVTHAIRKSFDLAPLGVRVFLDPTIDPESLPPIRLRHPEFDLARV
jgi:hypothetical protein